MIGAFIQVNNDTPYGHVRPIGYVVQESGCWGWVGCRSRNGYGCLRHNGRTVYAHRAMYESAVAPIPGDLVLRHLCGNTCCVRPDHLMPGTPKENVADTWALGRQAGQFPKLARCKRGHPLAEPNLTFGNSRRERACRVCRILARRRLRKRSYTKPNRCADLAAILRAAEAHLS